VTEGLVEFLLVRIAEEEGPARQWLAPEPDSMGDPAGWQDWHDARAKSWHTADCGWKVGEGLAEDCFCGVPARVLVDCETRRRIVSEYRETRDEAPMGARYDGQLEALERVIELLALPYADHPDYQEQWRP
jgi:hypothetical protein